MKVKIQYSIEAARAVRAMELLTADAVKYRYSAPALGYILCRSAEKQALFATDLETSIQYVTDPVDDADTGKACIRAHDVAPQLKAKRTAVIDTERADAFPPEEYPDFSFEAVPAEPIATAIISASTLRTDIKRAAAYAADSAKEHLKSVRVQITTGVLHCTGTDSYKLIETRAACSTKGTAEAVITISQALRLADALYSQGRNLAMLTVDSRKTTVTVGKNLTIWMKRKDQTYANTARLWHARAPMFRVCPRSILDGAETISILERVAKRSAPRDKDLYCWFTHAGYLLTITGIRSKETHELTTARANPEQIDAMDPVGMNLTLMADALKKADFDDPCEWTSAGQEGPVQLSSTTGRILVMPSAIDEHPPE